VAANQPAFRAVQEAVSSPKTKSFSKYGLTGPRLHVHDKHGISVQYEKFTVYAARHVTSTVTTPLLTKKFEDFPGPSKTFFEHLPEARRRQRIKTKQQLLTVRTEYERHIL